MPPTLIVRQHLPGRLRGTVQWASEGRVGEGYVRQERTSGEDGLTGIGQMWGLFTYIVPVKQPPVYKADMYLNTPDHPRYLHSPMLQALHLLSALATAEGDHEKITPSA